MIRRTVKFPETTVAGEPITTYAPTSPGAESYRSLAREVLASMSRRVGLAAASETPAAGQRRGAGSEGAAGRWAAADGQPAASSGRVRHDEKITVYVSAEELLALEQARLNLRARHSMAVDRGRIVRRRSLPCSLILRHAGKTRSWSAGCRPRDTDDVGASGAGRKVCQTLRGRPVVLPRPSGQLRRPFDLLLQLISRHKLDITEVALSQVTDEFIAHIKAAGSAWDLDQTSQFVVVAATLLDLKAARLIPSGEVEDPEDLALLEARDLLFARLLQYRAFKRVASYIAGHAGGAGPPISP